MASTLRSTRADSLLTLSGKPLAGVSGPRSQRGLSLLEVLFAAFLVGTVAVFLAPLFVRAVASNIEGNEASTAMNFGKSIQDQVLAMPINHQDLDVRLVAPTAPDPTVRRALSLVFDSGPHNRLGDFENEIGDEAWRVRTPADEAATGEVRLGWELDLDLREFSYSDIGSEMVSSAVFTDPGDLTQPLTLVPPPGDPDVFDAPLPPNISTQFRHIKEVTARLTRRRDSGMLGSTEQTAARRMRSY